ncbi:STAS-like domain-containing protein [Shewanella sp. SM69]|uniref:STAS-like domain-containing protein n=1 Tax=Shewanella TaxID=22 RepID=UPI0021DB3CB8|nr:STAS-like domain-containing protein [Shewanella sp. SM69]MCU8039631.1 STAS-like domain-containing protein [Shewanella sp. SM69]
MNDDMIYLKVSDYSLEPFGRYVSDGDGNGETFRKNYIIPAIRSGKKISILLDGVNDEYGSSFLVEAFANLIRKENIDYSEIKNKIFFISKNSGLLDEIDYYLLEANREKHEKMLRS